MTPMARTEPNRVAVNRAFGRLLRRWRSQRELSQLELALVAGVSARHLSFLETGRSAPSRDMILRLGAALDLPPHARNALLEAAGFAPTSTRSDATTIEPAILEALERMMAHHEPFPIVVMNPRHDILRTNVAAGRLLATFLGDADLSPPLNALALLFSPAARDVIVDWESTARRVIASAHGEALRHGDDPSFGAWVRSLADTLGPGSDEAADEPALPAFPVAFQRGALRASFYTTLTVFNAPRSAGAEHLRIESYFPLDDLTRRLCEDLAQGS
jgi:transcriptional regulator with XRE-family HTH domain